MAKNVNGVPVPLMLLPPMWLLFYMSKYYLKPPAKSNFLCKFFYINSRCQNEGPMVLTLHQERVVHIPGCPVDNDLCSLATLRKLFAHSLDNCNFNEMCVLNDTI